MTVQYQCMFFQTGQYGASSQDGGSLETKEWNMRSHLASGFNISHVIRELRQILRPSDWTQKTSHTGNTCNMSTSRVFDATLQWKQLGKNSTKTSTHTAAVGDDIRWDHWFLGMGQRNSPEWLIGNPIALDKASVTGRPAFEVPNSSQGEHSLPIYIYTMFGYVQMMYWWCSLIFPETSLASQISQAMSLPCSPKGAELLPSGSLFRTHWCSYYSLKGELVLEPMPNMEAMELQSSFWADRTWTKQCWKKCGCFFWREKLSICLYIKYELAQWVWIERQQAIEIEMWYTLNRF